MSKSYEWISECVAELMKDEDATIDELLYSLMKVVGEVEALYHNYPEGFERTQDDGGMSNER